MNPQSTEAAATNPALADRVDLLVVGRGPLARRVARLAAEQGSRPVLVRPCPAEAEVPVPIHFPTLWRLARQPGPDRPDWQEILRQARHTRAERAADDASQQPFVVVEGEARFAGPDRIELGGRSIRFRRAVLVAAPTALPLESPGADECQYLTEATLENMPGVPATMAIVGSGPEACQWAQVFGALGSQVHLVCPGGQLLPDEEPEIASLLQAQLAADQVRLHLDTAPPTFARMGNRKAVLLGVSDQQRKLLVDEVLYFGPQRCCCEPSLGLEAAGVATANGQVLTDAACRTSNRRIFVAGLAGDCPPPAVADLTAQIAVANALTRFACGFLYRRLRLDLVPRCLYTEPQVIRLGLEPRQAEAQPGRFAIYRTDLSPTLGFLEVVLHRRSGRIAGIRIVARSAGLWLAPLAILMARRLPLRTVADLAVCDPNPLEPLERIAQRFQADRPGWRTRLAGLVPARWRREKEREPLMNADGR